MYTGEREVEIDEKYKFNMTYQGKIVDNTGGLKSIQYFSYVGGLVKLAYDVMNEKNAGTPQAGDQYPLVLDAAFSHADATHTKNISRELSKSTPQLIFALMYKDWEHAEGGLAGKVGRKYEFDKKNDIEVYIKEVK